MGQEFRKLLFIDVIFNSGTGHADKCLGPVTRFAVCRSSSAVVLPFYVTGGRLTVASWAFLGDLFALHSYRLVPF